jgi:hypothetical protein
MNIIYKKTGQKVRGVVKNSGSGAYCAISYYIVITYRG